MKLTGKHILWAGGTILLFGTGIGQILLVTLSTALIWLASIPAFL